MAFFKQDSSVGKLETITLLMDAELCNYACKVELARILYCVLPASILPDLFQINTKNFWKTNLGLVQIHAF